MSDRATPSRKREKQPIHENDPLHPDYKCDNPKTAPPENVHDRPSVAELEHEQNQHAEQQLEQQEHEQDTRAAFQKGGAQAHQQGNRQH